MQKFLPFAALLGSFSTLICCVLPAAFVALGLGASFASLIDAVPHLIWFSEHKVFVFGTGFILIGVSGIFQWRNRYAPCPADPRLAEACSAARSWSKWTLAAAVLIYTLGFAFAFVLPHLM